MERADLAQVEAELASWGVVERAPALQLTRRFRAALARAAAELARDPPPAADTDPLVVAIERALASYPLPAGARVRRVHALFAAGVEMASLPEDALRLIRGEPG